MKKNKKWIPKIGDKVWVNLPHNAVIDKIYKDGSFQLRTEDGCLWSRYSEFEVEKVR